MARKESELTPDELAKLKEETAELKKYTDDAYQRRRGNAERPLTAEDKLKNELGYDYPRVTGKSIAMSSSMMAAITEKTVKSGRFHMFW